MYMRSRSDKSSDTKNPTTMCCGIDDRSHEGLHDGADELDRPAARRVTRKDRRGSKTPVAERDHRTRLRALTQETREAAAWWARYRSNEGFLRFSRRKIMPRQRVATRLVWDLDRLLTQGGTCPGSTAVGFIARFGWFGMV